MRVCVTFCLVGALHAGAAVAQTAVVTGRVTLPGTSLPLAGALVTAGGRDSAITDTAGRYVVRGVSRDSATLSVSRAGYLALSIPQLVVRTDTLHFDAQLHTDPVTLMGNNGRMAAPLMVIRLTGDSLAAIISVADTASFHFPVAEKDIEAIDVLVRSGYGAARHGGSAAGGVIRVLTKKAIGFPFVEMVQRRPRWKIVILSEARDLLPAKADPSLRSG